MEYPLTQSVESLSTYRRWFAFAALCVPLGAFQGVASLFALFAAAAIRRETYVAWEGFVFYGAYAAVVGAAFGLVSIACVPCALWRKPLWPTFVTLNVWTWVLTTVSTIAFGVFPLVPCGIALSLVALFIHCRKPDGFARVSAHRCPNCGCKDEARLWPRCPRCRLTPKQAREAAPDATAPRTSFRAVAATVLMGTAWLTFGIFLLVIWDR